MTSAAADVKDVTLLEVLDRILDKGVILAGDLTISVADVDLIFVGLKVMLASVERAESMHWGFERPSRAPEVAEQGLDRQPEASRG